MPPSTIRYIRIMAYICDRPYWCTWLCLWLGYGRRYICQDEVLYAGVPWAGGTRGDSLSHEVMLLSAPLWIYPLAVIPYRS